MATVGTLIVNVIARTKPFQRGMARAGAIAKRFAAVAITAAKAMAAIGATAVTLAALGFARLVKAQMAEIDVLAKTAKAMGINIEAMGGLELAASQSGLELKELTKGLQNMLKLIGDARRGLTTATDIFEILKLDFQELSELAPEDALKAIAEGFKNIERPAVRVNTAMALFGGRAGPKFLVLLAQGKAGLEAFRKEADRLGITLTDEGVQAVQDANDAFDKMKKSVVGLARTFAVQASPQLIAFADKLTSVATNEETKNFFANMAKDANTLAEALGIIGRGLDSIGISLEDVRLATFFDVATLGLGGKLLRAIQDVNEETDKLKDKAQETAQVFDEIVEESLSEGLLKAIDAGERLTFELRTPLEKYNETVTELTRLLQVLGPTFETTFVRAAKEARKELDEATRAKKRFESTGIAAVQRGTAAAFSAVQQSRREQDRVVRINAQQLIEDRKANDLLTSINKKTTTTNVAQF